MSLDFVLQNNPRVKFNDHRRVGVESLITHQDYHPYMLASPHVVPFLPCLGTSAMTVGILRGFRRFVKPFQYKMNSWFSAGTPEKEITNKVTELVCVGGIRICYFFRQSISADAMVDTPPPLPTIFFHLVLFLNSFVSSKNVNEKATQHDRQAIAFRSDQW